MLYQRVLPLALFYSSFLTVIYRITFTNDLKLMGERVCWIKFDTIKLNKDTI